MAQHNHNYGIASTNNYNRAFVIGIVLNLAYVIIQVIVGFSINSLSLLSDAGHNFLDVAGLALAMLAFKLAKSKTTEKYTYGYKKASILICLLNAIILLISIGAIGYEAFFRFQNPQPIPGKVIAIIALIGIFINGGSAFLFFKDKEKDMNVKSAFLHLMSDALVSLGLVIGGIIIHYTNLYWIDPLISVIICIVIIVSTWQLLKDSLKLSLDGVPENINVQNVKAEILKTNGVQSIHHLHIWALSTNENAMTAHLVVSPMLTNADIISLKENLKHELEELNIQHSTLEIDFDNTHHHSDVC